MNSHIQFKNTPVIVTGGAGFIGSHLVDALIEKGARVTVVDNLFTGHPENVNAEADFHELDIRDRDRVLPLFQSVKPRYVFHFAAQSSVKISVEQPYRDAEINILGGINVLDACCQGETEKVLFASTGGALYGEVPEGKCADETWPVKPMSPYAASKASFEYVLSVYNVNFHLQYVSLRFANVYGPRQDPNGEAGVVAIFSNRLLTHQPLKLFAMRTRGDSGCVRDYVYVKDVVDATLSATAMATDHYNVATGIPTSTQELLSQIAQIIGTVPQPAMLERRTGDLMRSVLSGNKLALTGWVPDTRLDRGLEETIEWFRTKGAP